MSSRTLNIVKVIEELISTKREFYWKVKNEQLITDNGVGYSVLKVNPDYR